MQEKTFFSTSIVAGLIWVSPAILSLLVGLSLFGLEIGQGASRDWNGWRSVEALKTRDTCGQKERLARIN